MDTLLLLMLLFSVDPVSVLPSYSLAWEREVLGLGETGITSLVCLHFSWVELGTIGFFLLILFHLNCSRLKKSVHHHLSSLRETTDQVSLCYNLLSLVFVAGALQLLGWHYSQPGRSCLVPDETAV